MICKRVIEKKKKKKEFVFLESRKLLIVPRLLSDRQYFRTPYDLQFCNENVTDPVLGELSATVMSRGYRVHQMTITDKTMIFNIMPRVREFTSADDLYKLLSVMNKPQVLSGFQTAVKRFTNIFNGEYFKFSAQSDVEYFENQIQEYPYEADVHQVINGQSYATEYTINQLYLDLMGITPQMMQEHLMHSDQIPHIGRMDSYIDTWNAFITNTGGENSVIQKREIQNYNGQRYVVDQMHKQFFIKEKDTVLFKNYWIYLIKPEKHIAIQNYQQLLQPKSACYRLLY